MKSIKYLIPIIPLYLVLTLPVFAQGNGSGGVKPTLYNEDRGAKMEEKQEEMEAKKADREAAMEEKKAEMEANREEKMAERCAAMQERAQERHQKFQENVDKHAENYGKVIAKLNAVSVTLQEKYPELDTSDFDALIVEMEDMVAAYVEAYGTFVTTVEAIADDASDTCGDGEGEKYKERLQSAKDELKEAIGERQSIRSLYAHEIREAIKDLREQVRDYMKEMKMEEVEDSMESEE